MTVTLASALGGFVVLALMFWPLERSYPARHQPLLRPAFALDLTFFLGQYLVWNLVALLALTWLSRELRALVPVAWQLGSPTVLGAVLVVLLGDVAVYWFHRASHSWAWLWRFHAVHHSVEHLDWLAGHREHPLDGLLTQLMVNVPALLLGFPLEWLSPLIVFRGLWAVFIHSNVQLPLGPLKWLFGAPEWHRWHHARSAPAQNFGNLAPWTDFVFGTHATAPDETYPLGLEGARSATYLEHLVHPGQSLLQGCNSLLNGCRKIQHPQVPPSQ